MKNITLFLILVTLPFSVVAQVIYEPFESEKLGVSREIKIQLPRNYDAEEEALYPLVIVLDGDYLFEPVVGNTDYQSYWEDIPNCIVVGINQSTTREDDFYYGDDTNFPVDESANFFEFIGMELIPYIESNYMVSDFRIVIGHDISANFINYYLFKDKPLFRAYVLLSPELAPEMTRLLEQRVPLLDSDIFYYLATADDDVKRLKTDILALDKMLQAVENPKFHYKFNNFDDANHYSLVGLGIPKALNDIFSFYKPISKKEYKENILTYEGSPYEYLMKKYEDIELFYGFKKKVVENDIRAIAAAANKKNDIESLKELSKLARKEYPDSMISAYYSGMYYEMDGNLKKALHSYQSGLMLNESDNINKDMLLDKIYELQE
ncbi:alpha/beta hydrolase-fold protein [uncultured Psychroserpens sp.]|uniref:alpha/beta hydrolase n=1 Tax=uncultured Psychroserpens sp. TaxID=255436 RepID=UPI00261A3832|nr:alpha/beta hydrolase-fold protein [uncultured Psychroserpens sp.]